MGTLNERGKAMLDVRATVLWALLISGMGVGGLFAQDGGTTVRRGRAGDRTVRQDGCPASVPPVASDSSATATDFIELSRGACAASCPVYRVRVGGDGGVTWVGESFVVAKGRAAETIDAIDARALIQQAADRGFWGLCARYARAGGDAASNTTTLSIAGQVKRVQETGEAAPAWLRALYADIEGVTNTHRWRHGEPGQETFGEDHAVVDAVMPKAGVTRLMRVAAQPDTGELAGMLADSSLDLNAADSSGWTALMYAAQGGSAGAVMMLLQAREDAARRSAEGETAMFAAVSSANSPAAKARMLKAAGVDINGQDRRGVTPLMIAARRCEVPGLVAGMLALAADPAKRDVDGRRAVDYLDEQVRVAAGPDAAVCGAVRGLLVVR